jgi:hypothetical protein
MRLTSSDGAGLRFKRLEARAVVEAPLAFTELHLTFENPEPRTIEGRFQVTLPPGASIGRLAMRIGDRWQEGEVVEKQRARAVYEDFLHRKQDPALLEQAAGNEFAARVFPIPASSEKELILSYSEELTGTKPYTLPLAGLPELESIDVQVSVRGVGTGTARWAQVNHRPIGDLVIQRAALGGHAALRSGNIAVARVAPVTRLEVRPLSRVLVLVDTSASRALGLDKDVTLVERVTRHMAETGGTEGELSSPPVILAAFDQTTDLVYQGPVDRVDGAVLGRIRSRRALGASDLHGALRWAAELAQKASLDRVVVVTDAVSTVGGATGDPTRETLRLLRAGKTGHPLDRWHPR